MASLKTPADSGGRGQQLRQPESLKLSETTPAKPRELREPAGDTHLPGSDSPESNREADLLSQERPCCHELKFPQNGPGWTPGRSCLGEASPDRFDSGSFFLPEDASLGRVVWTKASRWCTRYALASVWEGALLLSHGRGRAHSLDDGILAKLRGGRWKGSVTPGYPDRTGTPL